MAKNKNYLRGSFDNFKMKRFDALIATQKTTALYKVSFLKIIRKKPKKNIFQKWYFFYVLFLFFFSNGTLQRGNVFFALKAVNQNASFKL